MTLKEITEVIKKKQPIDITGVVRHIGLWLTSGCSDVIFENPKKPLTDDETSQDISIYCIHGTADRVSSFSLIARRLFGRLPKEITRIRLVSFEKRGQGASIEEFAEQLKEKIKKNGDKKIIFFTHSRGGDIATYFSLYLAQKLEIEILCIFTIGTPLSNGSDLALPPLTWISTSVNEMKKNSPFLNKLKTKINESNLKFYHFVAEKDSIVSGEAAYITGENHHTKVLDRHGHLSIMSSHRLVEESLIFIKKIIPTPSLKKTGQTFYFEYPILKEISDAIKLEVNHLKERNHLYDTIAKEFVLIKLREIIKHLPEINPYPKTQTIGQLIDEFLNDNKIYQSTTPQKILETQLNYPFTLFCHQRSKSLQFIENLAKKYENQRLVDLHNVSSISNSI